jgi:hypothetical protein
MRPYRAPINLFELLKYGHAAQPLLMPENDGPRLISQRAAKTVLGGFHLAIDVKPDAKLGECQMTQGNLFDTRIAGTSWWRCACNGVPVWRWPSNL